MKRNDRNTGACTQYLCRYVSCASKSCINIKFPPASMHMHDQYASPLHGLQSYIGYRSSYSLQVKTIENCVCMRK